MGMLKFCRIRLLILDRLSLWLGRISSVISSPHCPCRSCTGRTGRTVNLVLLDEVGRGTATFDGLSIAWAVVEHISSETKSRTLFATHYHELTELADLLPGVKNVHVSARETSTGIVFLKRVETGSADKSYGIEVARMAGLPPAVIARAREVLDTHEQAEHPL